MWALATIEDGKPALVVDGKLYPLAALAAAAGKSAPSSNVDLFADWDNWKPVLTALAASAANSGIAPVDAKLAAPLLYPGKVLCAGANYYDHMAEMGFPGVKKETQRLFFFFKPPRNAVVGPGATVVMPRGTKKYDWEIELAAVIGKTARYVSVENALATSPATRSRSISRRAISTRRRTSSTNSTGSPGRRPTPPARWGRGSCRRRHSATCRTSR